MTSWSRGGKAYLVVCQQLNKRVGVVCLVVIEKNLPRPEGDHEPKPREEEHASMNTDNIEQRHRASLVVDGVELWGFPEQCRVETNHVYWMSPRKGGSNGLLNNSKEMSWTKCMIESY